MRRIISALIFLLLFVGTFAFYTPASAEDMTMAQLRQAREAYIAEVFTPTTFDRIAMDHKLYDSFLYGVEGCLVLLYTEQAKNWTYRTVEELAEKYGGYDMPNMYYGFFELIDPIEFIPGELPRTLPRLCSLIRYHGVTKEELYAARDRMEAEPHCIDAMFPNDRDLEFLDLDDESMGLRLEDFMIEALYLKNDRDMREILSMPFTVCTEKGVLAFRHIIEYANTDSAHPERIYGKIDVSKLEEAKEYLIQLKHEKNDVEFFISQINQVEAMIIGAPKAGEQTVLYILCSVGTGCALPAAVLLARRKKRRV